MNRRYAQNFQFGLAYTWSRAMDYANNDDDDIRKAFEARPQMPASSIRLASSRRARA